MSCGRYLLVCVLCFGLAFVGCGASTSVEHISRPADPKDDAEIRSLAENALGRGSEVLAIGDLAQNGHQQVIVINRAKSAGLQSGHAIAVTRVAILQRQGSAWTEVLRCDEYLKNSNGFLGGAPLLPAAGWELELDSPGSASLRALYFTPLQHDSAIHPPRVAVKWNPAAGRYQALDKNSRFVAELPSLEIPASELR